MFRKTFVMLGLADIAWGNLPVKDVGQRLARARARASNHHLMVVSATTADNLGTSHANVPILQWPVLDLAEHSPQPYAMTSPIFNW